MKSVFLATFGFSSFLTISSFSQNAMTVDLQQQVKSKGIEVFNRELSLIHEDSHSGIRLSKAEGEGIAWLKDVDFSSGILEFDIRGEDVKGHSFVGIAFHGKDNATFDAVYLRPFQFREQDPVLKNRAIQYISLPDYPWRTLRAKFPDTYEHSIEPPPDPNSWVSVRVVIKDSTVSTYINGNREPSLVVNKTNHRTSGSLGFYVADTSGGDFSNLTVTKTN